MTNNKDKKVLNVPNLRFPNFFEEWEEHYLSEYLEFKNGLNPNAEKFGRGIKFISVMDILSNNVITYDCIRASVEITAEELKSFIVKNGDILFQRSSETLEDVGRANVYIDDKPAVFGGFVIRGKKKSEYNPLFFKYLLATPYARRKIIPMGAGAQHFNIGQEGLSKVKLYFPILQEQHKIASLLQLIDERIATQNKIIEKLQSLIRGIVTKICSGAFVKGKYVFLRDILIERHIKNTENYEVYSVSVSQGIINQIDYLGRSFASKETLHYNVVNYGDIVYTKSPTGDFPYGIVKRSHIQKPIAVSPLYGVYQPKNDYIGKYLHLYFKSPINTKNYLHRLIQKGAKNTINITNSHFLDNNVFIPEKPELINIVNLTSAIEDKLVLASRMLDSLKSQKGYLLSKMFI